MKKLILCLVAVFCVLTVISCTSLQSADIETFQEVLTADGMTRDELYNKAQAWFVDSFVDSSEVIELQDKGSGIIKGKYTMTIPRNAMCELVLESVITVEVKDGKARFTVSAPVNGYGRVGYERIAITGYTTDEVERINISRASLFESFKMYIVTAPEEW